MTLEPVDIALLVYCGVIFVIGVPGNIMVLTVYLKKVKKSGTFVFISFVALSDLIVCLAVCLPAIFILTAQINTRSIICKLMSYTFALFNILSLISSTAVAFDRYVAVCHPYTKRLSIPKSFILSLICFIASMIFAAPTAVVVSTSPGDDGHVTCDRKNTRIWVTLSSLAVFFVIVLPSFLSTIICYSLVWRSIRNHRLVGNAHGLQTLSANGSVKVSTKTTNNFASFIQTRNGNVKSSMVIRSVMHINETVDTRPVVEGALSENSVIPYHSDKMEGETENRVSQHPISKPESGCLNLVKVNDHSISSHSLRRPTVNQQNNNPSNVRASSQNLNASPIERKENEFEVWQPARFCEGRKVNSSKMMKGAVQRRITLVLFLTAVLSITIIPITLLAKSCTKNTLNDIRHKSEFVYAFLYLARYFGLLKNVLDPFIYSLCDKKFRSECFKIFRCRLKDSRS